jgi:hypothetical protein
MTMRPIKAWALVIRNSRGEWSDVSLVQRTRGKVKAAYVSDYDYPKLGEHFWRKHIKSGGIRLACVTITETE